MRILITGGACFIGCNFVRTYHKTYGLPIMITRSSNNFGPYQYPEKLVPLLILNALYDKKLPIYGEGKNVRDWIYVLDNCEGLDFVFRKGEIGATYNIGAGIEKTNIEVANLILEELNKPKSLRDFVKDRLGHDFRYSLDTGKIKQLGLKPKVRVEEGIKRTIRWYVENRWWWVPLLQ